MTVLVLDTSAFIQGFNTGDAQLYTTYAVVDEIREEMARIRVENWVQTGKLTVVQPDSAQIEKVKKTSSKLGESSALSEADHSVIALALQLGEKGSRVVIISDDYGVQNLSDELGLKYQGLATHGIKDRFQWIIYCPGCRKQYQQPQPDNVCGICGTPLKRKPGKKRKANR